MGLIFLLSAQPDLGTGLGVADLIARKFVHAGVYAALTLLWWWALTGGGPTASRRASVIAALISFLYAISDEYHQTFTEGRSGTARDVAIDTVGIVFACWLILSGRATQLLAALRAKLAG
jgi:VanZ family protein